MKQRNILKGPCQDWEFWYWYRPSSGLPLSSLLGHPFMSTRPFGKSVASNSMLGFIKIPDLSKRKNCFWAVSTGLPGPGQQQGTMQALLNLCCVIWELVIPYRVLLISMSQWFNAFKIWALILRGQVVLISLGNQMLGSRCTFPNSNWGVCPGFHMLWSVTHWHNQTTGQT